MYTDVPASGMYFLSYEYVKELTRKELGTEGGWALVGTILAGGSAGVANWAVGMPADVLKCKYIIIKILRAGRSIIFLVFTKDNEFISYEFRANSLTLNF